jgi:hypothetical protein
MGKQLYTVFAPTAISPDVVIHSRIGKAFVTLQAARRQAKTCRGQVRPFGSNEILEDFSS